MYSLPSHIPFESLRCSLFVEKEACCSALLVIFLCFLAILSECSVSL